MKNLIVSLLLLCGLTSVSAQEFKQMTDVVAFKASVQSASGSIQTIQSHFEQKKHLAVLVEPAKSSGQFYFKRGGFVRWEYEQPEQQSIILNGSKVYIIENGERQAVNSRTEKAYRQMNGIIADVIHGDAFANMAFEYRFFESSEAAKVVMIPTESTIAAHIESIVLFFNETFHVDRLIITNTGGDYTIYRFFDQQYDVEIPGDVFEPKALKK